MTTETNYINKLQQRNYILVVQNEFIKEENEQLKQQITQLKHKNNQQEKTIDRLIKIIRDEHY